MKCCPCCAHTENHGLVLCAGPIRKIKPISVAVEGREGERRSAASPLQVQSVVQ